MEPNLQGQNSAEELIHKLENHWISEVVQIWLNFFQFKMAYISIHNIYVQHYKLRTSKQLVISVNQQINSI